jgi:dCMP deaminase
MTGKTILGEEAAMYLDIANRYAQTMSGCRKVAVGCVIVKDGNIISLGANKTIPALCKVRQCLRVEKYGEASKDHRLPSDCRAIHSEVDALVRLHESAKGSSVYITRYPCEACARALATAKVADVYFGREQPISEETERILYEGRVNVHWVSDWTEEDTND